MRYVLASQANQIWFPAQRLKALQLPSAKKINWTKAGLVLVCVMLAIASATAGKGIISLPSVIAAIILAFAKID